MAGDATFPTAVLTSPAPLPAAPAAVPPASNAMTVTTPSSPVASTESNSSSVSPAPDTAAQKDVVADMHVVQPISVDARVEGGITLETAVSQEGRSGAALEQFDTAEGKGEGEETEEKTDQKSNKHGAEDASVKHIEENEKVIPATESKDEEKPKEIAPMEEATNATVIPTVAEGSQEKEEQGETERNTVATEAEEKEKRGEKRVGPDQQPQDPLESASQAAPVVGDSPAKKQKTDSNDAVDANTESNSSILETTPKSQPISSTSLSKKSQTGSVEASKGIDNSQAPKNTGASVLGTGMQLMLRSSPVDGDVNSAQSENVPRRLASAGGSKVSNSSEKGGLHSAVSEKGDTGLSAAAPVPVEHRETAGEPKKKRRVSWASEGKLVDVRFIDSRLDLLRSWDPESEITIPFSPGQVRLLRAEEQNRAGAERAGQNNGDQSGSKKLTTFEAARKKEHDMELERAKQAREELQRKLDNMHPSRPWEHPAEIILPAECRIDPDSVEGYSLVEEGYRANLRKRDPNSATPPSPPPELQSSRDEVIRSEADIPTFPLCDGAATEAGEVPDPSHGPGARLRSDGRHDGVVPQRYDDTMENNRMMGGGEDRLHEVDHSNPHETGFRMDPHDRMDRGDDKGMSLNRTPDRMGERGERPYHRGKLQHILSKLRSSGLFNQNSGFPGAGTDNPEDYPGGARPEELDGRGGMYEDQHGLPGRGAGRNEGVYHSNGGYAEDDRRGQGMDDGMGPGPGVGMGNGGMGPPQPPFGHPGQMPPGFPQHMQQGGMIDGFPFMAPIPPPPPMGIGPNMLPMGMGMPMPPMGMPMPFGMGPGPGGGPMPMGNSKKGGKGGKSGSSSNRVETITRPKSKGPKQRKRCKYFGTKQGCRDGASCVFAHN